MQLQGIQGGNSETRRCDVPGSFQNGSPIFPGTGLSFRALDGCKLFFKLFRDFLHGVTVRAGLYNEFEQCRSEFISGDIGWKAGLFTEFVSANIKICDERVFIKQTGQVFTAQHLNNGRFQVLCAQINDSADPFLEGHCCDADNQPYENQADSNLENFLKVHGSLHDDQ